MTIKDRKGTVTQGLERMARLAKEEGAGPTSSELDGPSLNLQATGAVRSEGGSKPPALLG